MEKTQLKHKAALLLLAVLLMAGTAAQAASGRKTLRVATFNNEKDFPSKIPDSKWTTRCPLVVQLLQDEDYDIIGMQEPYWNQIQDLEKALPQYAWTGVSVVGTVGGRQVPDGVRGSRLGGQRHHNPIFYKKDRFELLDKGAFWFSETPDVPASVSWDSYTVRNCNWAKFRDRRTGKEFFVFNSHFDHKGWTARAQAARILIDKVKTLCGRTPVVCTGDYNSRDSTEPYRILASTDAFKDSYYMTKKHENDGYDSFSNYKPELRRTDRLDNYDHVFVSPFTKVKSWRLVTTKYQGRFPSDHCPIVIEWKLP